MSRKMNTLFSMTLSALLMIGYAVPLHASQECHLDLASNVGEEFTTEETNSVEATEQEKIITEIDQMLERIQERKKEYAKYTIHINLNKKNWQALKDTRRDLQAYRDRRRSWLYSASPLTWFSALPGPDSKTKYFFSRAGITTVASLITWLSNNVNPELSHFAPTQLGLNKPAMLSLGIAAIFGIKTLRTLFLPTINAKCQTLIDQHLHLIQNKVSSIEKKSQDKFEVVQSKDLQKIKTKKPDPASSEKEKIRAALDQLNEREQRYVEAQTSINANASAQIELNRYERKLKNLRYKLGSIGYRCLHSTPERLTVPHHVQQLKGGFIGQFTVAAKNLFYAALYGAASYVAYQHLPTNKWSRSLQIVTGAKTIIQLVRAKTALFKPDFIDDYLLDPKEVLAECNTFLEEHSAKELRKITNGSDTIIGYSTTDTIDTTASEEQEEVQEEE